MEKLIEVINLKTYFYTEGGTAKAVDGVSFDIYKGEVLSKDKTKLKKAIDAGKKVIFERIK